MDSLGFWRRCWEERRPRLIRNHLSSLPRRFSLTFADSQGAAIETAFFLRRYPFLYLRHGSMSRRRSGEGFERHSLKGACPEIWFYFSAKAWSQVVTCEWPRIWSRTYELISKEQGPFSACSVNVSEPESKIQ